MAKSQFVYALLVSGALAAGASVTAHGQSYPTRPIELVSPTSAGSGTDIYARALAEITQREKLLPQPFILQNRTGGGSLVAYNYFQTKRGDPYVMLAATGTIAIMAARPDVNIGLENYTPLALFAVDPQAIMVGADTPYKTLRDLAEAARKQPDTISALSPTRSVQDAWSYICSKSWCRARSSSTSPSRAAARQCCRSREGTRISPPRI